MTEEVEYRREMNRNYMVIHSRMQWNDTYTMRMLSGNKIPGLLGFQEKWVDGRVRFYYDITSKQPLNRILEHRNLSAWELRRVISDLVLVLRQMERYLLDERRLCLKPEYMYVEPETYHCSLCMIPGGCTDFPKELLELAQYLLDHVDHSDGEAVVLAFAVFRECRKENFGVDDIERCLGDSQARRKEENPEKKRQEETDLGKKQSEKPQLRKNQLEKSYFRKEDGENQKLDHKKSETEESLEQRRWNCGKRNILVLIGGAVLLPILVFLIFGIDKVFQWKWVLAAAELALLAGIVWTMCSQKEVEETDSGDESILDFETFMGIEEELWEKEETAEGIEKERNVGNKDYEEEPEDEDTMQTVLLTACSEQKENRKLVSLADRREIPISYFPFLIGKNKGLTDFCLNEPGISRLHVKLEQTGNGYSITDLNSTNGTKLNGEVLNANETRALHIGDEVVLAELSFRFQ